MRRESLARWLRAAGLVLFLLILVSAAAGTWLVRRSFPRTQGVLQLAGLQAPVDVYRSAEGVPHIYASSEYDLFYAQGYVHAQDRFWQMDFFRHVGAGRLAEMFGSSQLETDTFLRTMGWERIAEQEYQQLDQGTRTIMEAYAEGVNAYLAEHQGSAASLEYAILGLLTPDYEIAPWTPVNTLTWAKAMAWDLGSNMGGEIDRALLLDHLTHEQVEQIYPEYPFDHPVIAPSPGDRAAAPSAEIAPAAQARPALERARAQIAALNSLLQAGSPSLGSNSWVVSGDRSASGAAMLANDTHLGIQMPSIWYENGLHCRPVSADCRFEVAGFSFAGVPAVVIGHNGQIAWGVTNLGADVQDLYIERVNPENPQQYEVDGEWVDMQIVSEQVRVAGQEPTELTVRLTHHGPIISDSFADLEDFGAEAGLELPDNYAVSLSWTALKPSSLFQAVIALNLAQDWDDFRAALRHWDVPSQNFVYADAAGNIGYQMPGEIPIRGEGIGWLPAPGWDSSYDWTGSIPFHELASVYNPTNGYLATANNAVVDNRYPYFVERGWSYGFRAQRIEQLLAADGDVSADDIAAIQGDNHNAMADVFVPLLEQVSFEDPELQQALQMLSAWDRQDDLDSPAAALFNVFWRRLLNRTFYQDLGDGPLPTGSRSFMVMTELVSEPDSFWWDVPETEAVETRDDLLRWALTTGYDELSNELGSDPDAWRWGDLHTATFRNQSLGESGVAPIEALFNRGPFQASGGSAIVNATGWDPVEGYEVTAVPSQRLIVDFADLDRTRAIHTTGQSGHAFHPHYIDQADPWRMIEYHNLGWTLQAVSNSAAAHLQLQPASTAP